MVHAILTGEPHPVKALWSLNDLILAMEGSRETYEALMKLEFFVGSDFFMTPTLELADLILPPCTYLERDEIEYNYYTYFIAARRKVIEPMYETRNERDMDFEIIRRMGLRPPEEWTSSDEFNDYCLRNMGLSFEDLKEKVYMAEPIRYKKYEEKGFNTPSGKVELYSETLRDFGYDPLPFYQENPETPLSTPEFAEDYPLILITGSRHVVYFHAANRQIPWLREIAPDPTLEIHPEKAEELGIRDGDWVWVEAPKGRGRVRMKAFLTEALDPRVVHAYSHWWFPERKEDPLHGVFDSNINVILTNDPPYEPVTGATPLRGNLCRVYKADAP
ncbi:MAG: molybdopterin-dependent oxidoreductase [Nitrospinota bacterium]